MVHTVVAVHVWNWILWWEGQFSVLVEPWTWEVKLTSLEK